MATIEAELETPVQAPIEHPHHKKLVIMAWSGDLDKIWPSFILGTTGAAMGMDTTIFFTFWGLFPLVRNDVHITGENWMQKMMAFMNRPGDEHMKLSKMNFAGMGPAMLGQIAREHHAALPHELMESAQELGVRLLPCQMSMDLFGIKAEDLIEGVDAPVGATTMLELAQGATTFFI
jgi:peroxiredoxin family protein